MGLETCPYNQLPGEAMWVLHMESPPREPAVWEPPLWRDGSAKKSDSPPTSKFAKLCLVINPGTLANVKNGNSTNRKWAALEDSVFFSTFLVLVSALPFILSISPQSPAILLASGSLCVEGPPSDPNEAVCCPAQT